LLLHFYVLIRGLVSLVLVLTVLSLSASLILNLRVGVFVLYLVMVHVLFGLRNKLGPIEEVLQVRMNRLHVFGRCLRLASFLVVVYSLLASSLLVNSAGYVEI
jgi:hypothetical protein